MKNTLISFEREVADAFERGEIRGPIHLSGGNEDELIEIFKDIRREDWVFSTWRSHYHALLHGIPRDEVMAKIMAGKSMNLNFPEYRFYTSAIVGGILPIALGVSAAGNKVFCFVGDMCARSGIFHEAVQYAGGHKLPVEFIIEDNGLSTDTPTEEVWGDEEGIKRSYFYTRIYPHVGTGKFVSFV